MAARAATNLFIVGAKRTPFGTFGGTLKGMSATDLAVHATRAAIADAGVSAEYVVVVRGRVLLRLRAGRGAGERRMTAGLRRGGVSASFSSAARRVTNLKWRRPPKR